MVNTVFRVCNSVLHMPERCVVSVTGDYDKSL